MATGWIDPLKAEKDKFCEKRGKLLSVNPKESSILWIMLIISIWLMKSIIAISFIGLLLVGAHILMGDFFPTDLGENIFRLMPMLILGTFGLPALLRIFYGKIPEDLKHGYLAKLIKQTQDNSTDDEGKE